MAFRELFELRGRTALVTGASRGIGRAIALGLAEYGADVAIHCGTRRAAAQGVADEAARLGVRSGVVVADLADPEAPRHAFEEAVALLGRVDILVSNASIQIRRRWQDLPREEFDHQVTVNWRSGWELMQLALPPMIERRWGRVVTIGSVQQTVPATDMLVYAAVKSAQLNMVRNLAKQVGPFGVTVNNLAPGFIVTDRNQSVMDDPVTRERVGKRIPVGFLGQPEDCVGTAVLLCSEAGRYITGADFVVDGGWGLP